MVGALGHLGSRGRLATWFLPARSAHDLCVSFGKRELTVNLVRRAGEPSPLELRAVPKGCANRTPARQRHGRSGVLSGRPSFAPSSADSGPVSRGLPEPLQRLQRAALDSFLHLQGGLSSAARGRFPGFGGIHPAFLAFWSAFSAASSPSPSPTTFAQDGREQIHHSLKRPNILSKLEGAPRRSGLSSLGVIIDPPHRTPGYPAPA